MAEYSFGGGLRFDPGAAFEQGRQQAKESRIGRLLSGAYNNPQDRQSRLAQIALLDPQRALDAESAFQSADDNRRKAEASQRLALGQKARAVVQAAESGNHALRDGLYRELVPEANQAFGGALSPEWDDSQLDGLRTFGSIYGGQGGDLRDRYRVVGGALVDLQDPTKAVFTAPAAPRYFEGDNGVFEATPQGLRRLPEAGGMPGPVTTNQTGERGRYVRGADGSQVFIGEDVPAHIAAGITADPAAFQRPTAQAPGLVTGGGFVPRGTAQRQAQEQRQQAADRRAEDANRRAQEAADRAAEAAKAKGSVGKALTQGTVNELTKDAGRLDNLSGLSGSFQDAYAGNVAGGGLENWAGRNLPGGFGATKGQAEWWQQYDRLKNQVRNELFGASLTEGEKRAFEAADINPNLAPAVIRQNLAAQQAIIRKALDRKARTWAAQGYNPEAIRVASGVDVAPMRTAQSVPPTVTTQAQFDALPSGALFIEDGMQYRKP